MTGKGSDLTSCPACGSDLTGPEIPAADRHFFGATHFSRRIAIVDRDRDCCIAYACPDCGHEWPRSIGEIIAVMETDEPATSRGED